MRTKKTSVTSSIRLWETTLGDLRHGFSRVFFSSATQPAQKKYFCANHGRDHIRRSEECIFTCFSILAILDDTPYRNIHRNIQRIRDNYAQNAIYIHIAAKNRLPGKLQSIDTLDKDRGFSNTRWYKLACHIKNTRQLQAKHCSYVYMHCPENEQCLTYSIKHEVLEHFCDTWYDWIYKIKDNYARNRNWSEKHKNIFTERRPNTRQLRTDWTSRWNSTKKSSMYSNIRLAFYATMTYRWHFKR